MPTAFESGDVTGQYNAALNETVMRNVTGAPTKPSLFHVDSVSDGTASACLVVFNHANPTLGSTFPTIAITVPASAHLVVTIGGPDGGPTFDKGMSIALVDAADGSSVMGNDRKGYFVSRDV